MVLNESHDRQNNSSYKMKPLSFIHWLVFIFLLSNIGFYSMQQSSRCHKDLDFKSGFNSSLAFDHLNIVTGYGDRSAGSFANQVLAHKYIKENLQGIISSTKHVDIELDDQNIKSSNFRAHNHVTSYSGLSNIIVRISEKRQFGKRKSLLINCHFDTPVNSPGASDVFVSCATMIETIRVLATGQYKLPHDVIFLFNGAEESILPASHAFITQHKWAKSISAFINLEGCGSGGRMVVFQTGPGIASRMFVDAFSRSAKNPSANIAGEELFQSGLLPADTDFRIFRDYGRIPGIDMAYISDGYVYHTEHDVPTRIEKNCLELAGENLLLLIVELVSSPKFDDLTLLSKEVSLPTDFYNDKKSEANSIAMFSEPHRHKVFSSSNRYVYFDVLGYFVVRMPFYISKAFTFAITIALFIHIFLIRHSKFNLSSTKQKFYGIGLALLLNFIFLFTLLILMMLTATCAYLFDFQMTWYARRYNLLTLYASPALVYLIFFHFYLFGVCNKSSLLYRWPFSSVTSKVYWIIPKKDKSVLSVPDCLKEVRMKHILEDFNDASLIIHNCVLFFMLSEGIATSYVFYLWIAIPLIGAHIFRYFNLNSSFYHLLLFLLPHASLYHSYTVSIILNIFIPITGRSGQGVSSDFLVAAIMFILIMPIFNILSGYVRVTKNSHIKFMFKTLVVSSVVLLLLLKFTALGFPYASKVGEDMRSGTSPTAQQRLHIIHVNTILREDPRNSSKVTKNESHMLLYTIDANGYKYLTPQSKPTFLASLFDPVDLDKKIIPMPRGFINNCNSTLPYCGVPYHYPFANVFGTGYKIPLAELHSSTPDPKFKIKKISIMSENDLKNADRKLPKLKPDFIRYNMSVALISGPPHTHFYIRTDPKLVRLIAWSFDKSAGYPQPMYMPYPKNVSDLTSIGSHYFISHINGQAAVTNGVVNEKSEWETPLEFWLLFDVYRKSEKFKDDCVEFTLSANYFDAQLPNSGRSKKLNYFLKNHVPPWITPTPYVGTYSHYKLSLKNTYDVENKV